MEGDSQIPEVLPKMQTIHQIGQEEQFKTSEKQREYNRRYYHEHKEQIKAQNKKYHKKYYHENRRQELARKNKYNQKHREQCRVHSKKFRQENPDYIRKYYKENKEEQKIRVSEYQKRYPEYMREKTRRRHANKLNAPGSHTVSEIIALRNQARGVCPGYNKNQHYVGKNKLTLDHIIPLSKNGSEDISNLQMMCQSCNSSKRDS